MKNNYQLRNSQKDCIEFSKRYFNTTTSKKPEMLWNCKMRFGKCFTAISFAKEMNYSKILIITHMPAVMNEWKETVENHTSLLKIILHLLAGNFTILKMTKRKSQQKHLKNIIQLFSVQISCIILDQKNINLLLMIFSGIWLSLMNLI